VLADRLPPGAQPADHVWSSYGGRWRTIEVGPLDVSSWGRPGVGIAPAVLDVVCTVPLLVVGALKGHFVRAWVGALVSLASTAVLGTLVLAAPAPGARRHTCASRAGGARR
jgi:hypothetical protein